MRYLVQRVKEASVEICKDGSDSVVGKIGKGFLVFVGVCDSDTREIADKLDHKLLNLRIFEDENGKTNKSLSDVDGELLLVSQFTLYADCKHGNRPSFTKAGTPDKAKELYEYVIDSCKKAGYKVETGEFGADMKVSLVNDGPFTVILDSEEL